MLGAQSVPCSTNTSAEVMAPLADSSIRDQLEKACPLVDQARFKIVDVSYSGLAHFLLQYTLDAIVDWVQNFRSGEFGGHSVGGMKLGTFRSRKATVHMSCARCVSAPSCSKTKPHPGISGICLAVASWQEDCRDSKTHSL